MPDIVTLAEAKAWLRNPPASADTALQQMVAAVTPLIEAEVGAVVPRDVTRDYDAASTILLPARVVSVTSVTAFSGGVGTAYALVDPAAAAPAYGYTVDLAAGLLRGAFPRGSVVRVVMREGMAVTPANVKMAALEQVRMWFEALRPARPEQGVADAGWETEVARVAAAGLHPWIKQMLKPQLRGPAVA